jgi:hypothetical protein
MRSMATGTDGSAWVALAYQACVNASLPLLELLRMTSATNLDRCRRERGLTRNAIGRRRMAVEVGLGMASGASERTVDRLSEMVPINLQRERVAIVERFLEPRCSMARQALVDGASADAGAFIPMSASATGAAAAPMANLANAPRPVAGPDRGFVTLGSANSW